jgi:hypothetical protein
MAKKSNESDVYAHGGSDKNPAPTIQDFETFHVTANKELSKRVVSTLTAAGIRTSETIWNEIGRPEYVIEVHRDDLAKADNAFAKNLGPSRNVTSKGADADTANKRGELQP